MPDGPPAHHDAESLYRAIPSIDRLLESPRLREAIESSPRSLVVEAARQVVERYRVEIASKNGELAPLDDDALARRTADEVRRRASPPLTPVINATGVIIHTNLGRAPLADAAVRAMTDVARGYAPIEMDLDTGARGKRTDLIRPLLRELTGAESATVVNNNAAALVLILNTLAKGRGVIVSRGELIEIGGSFRLPAVMEAGGCALREVGATNKTRLNDYEQAVDEYTAALLSVHPSNYRIEGFTESVPIGKLSALGRRHNLPVIHDIGSGLLRRYDHPALAREPDARTSIDAGADLVLFSGDKLLGGPQAGVVVGRSDLIAKIEANPMMRAMRVDRITLAALGATLQLHRDADQARRDVPVLRMVMEPLDRLRERAERIAGVLRESRLDGAVTVQPSEAHVGGGATPVEPIESVAVCIAVRGISAHEFARRLRLASPPVIARTREDAVWLDLRTILPGQDERLVTAVRDSAAQPGA